MNYNIGDKVYIIPEKVSDNPFYNHAAGKIGTITLIDIETNCCDIEFENGVPCKGISPIRFILASKLQRAME